MLTEAARFRRNFYFGVSLTKRTRRLQIKCINPIRYLVSKQIINTPTRQVFSLKQRIFLSHKTIQKTVWEFLYRGAKKRFRAFKPLTFFKTQTRQIKDSRKHIFLNAHKPLIWKMRSARYAHWNLKTKGKLNEYRYNKLLGTELFFVGKTEVYLLLPFMLFTVLTATLSWRQIKQVMEYQLFCYNGHYDWLPNFFAVGDIVELPLGLPFKSLRKNMKKVYITIINKARRTTYKNFIARKLSGIRKPIRIPKIFKKLPIHPHFLRDRFAFDPSLRCFAVIHPIITLTKDIEHKLTTSSVLTLQNWRYRFD